MSLLGKTYAQGLKASKKSGDFPFRLEFTFPPGALGGKGIPRIVRERFLPQGREWLLSYPDYFKSLK